MPLKPLRSFALIVAVAGGALSSAFAGPLVQKGVLEAAPPIRTIGTHVEWLGALESTLPSNWRLVVAPGVKSAAKVSWTPGDTWVEVATRVSYDVPATVVVYWNKHEVLVRPQTTSERLTWEKEQKGKAAARRRPSARHKASSVRRISPAPNAKAHEEAAILRTRAHACPVTSLPAALQANASVQTSAAPAAPAASVAPRVQPSSLEWPPSGSAQAFDEVSVRVPLEALAHRYGLTLRYEALDYPLPGPVTLMLQGEISSDIDLLQRALGATVPLSITEYREDRLLVVRSAAVPSFVVLARYPRPKRSFFARLFGRRPHAASAKREVASTKAQVPQSSSTEAAPVPAGAAPSVAPEQVSGATAPSAPVRAIQAPASATAVQPLTLHAYGAPFGPLFEQVAKSNGYSVIFSPSVDQNQPVSVAMEGAGAVQGFRALAAKAGCVVAIDETLHVVTVMPVSALGAVSDSGEGN